MRNFFSCVAFYLLTISSGIAQNISTPSEFLGYELGSQYSRHADVVDYFRYIADKSPMVSYHTYGQTNERRPLIYAVISSEENLNNIERIREEHLLSSKKKTKRMPDKAFVWLSYNVHGNEASSTEAAMKTLYSLITENQEWLKNTIVIIDPCVNPDGRDRYVNWYNQTKTEPYSVSQAAAEHHEPWPGGRPNHYLFDLNRDWAWATQVETQQRLKIYNQWLPHIHVDFHEQGINEPYYFAPAAEPFHEIITPFQKEFQTKIGKNNARYFDEKGWLYFTRERFDLLYPSYGDTYPTYMGAIGMTYEQAGNTRAGLGIKTDEGYILSLKDRIAHHFTTGLSTVEVASENAEKLNSEFHKYFNTNDTKYKSYILKGSADKIAAVKKLLDKHEIIYNYPKEHSFKGFNYNTSREGSLETNDASSLLVSTDQPKGKMAKVLFEPSVKLTDSLTYDITAWSIPYAYGLEAIASTREITAGDTIAEKEISNKPVPDAAGYISKWDSMEDARFLASLLKNGVRVRFTEKTFQSEGQTFKPGSLVITKSDNMKLVDFDKKLVKIANEHQRKLVAATSGFATRGPDFGSAEIKIINPQKVAVLKGEEVSSLNFGEIWYYFEKDLDYPVTPINTSYFDKISLEEFDVLILPEGNYDEFLTDKALKKIKEWIKNGGNLIAIGQALKSLSNKEDFSLQENKMESAQDSTDTGKFVPYAERERENIKNLITGSIVKTKIDNTHPMAFGYNDNYFSLKLSDASYRFLNKGYTVGYIQKPEIVSGFAGSNATKKIENSLVFGEQPIEKGCVVYMVDNPLFRAFWENGKLLFANSVFFVNNNGLNSY